MKSLGRLGEDIAADYLVRNGYTIFARNWRGAKGLRCPEIDIIAGKDEVIVFVEVKAFFSRGFGEPEYRVTQKKKARLSIAATAYLSFNYPAGKACRQDVIIVDFRKMPPAVKHIENAFSAFDDNR